MSSADTITKPAPASVFLGNEVVNAVVLHADSTDLWLCLKRPASPQRFARTQLVLDGGESVLVDGIIRTCEPWGAGHCVRLSHLGASPTLRARLAAFAAARDSKPPGAPPGAPPTAGKLLGSCAIAGVACSDYYGSSDVTPVKSACEAVGKWNPGACPAGGVGTCTKTEPGGIVNKTHSYPPGTAATSKMACDNTPGGVFSGG